MQAVSKEMLDLLRKLSSLDYLQEYYLAGGTNLAIRYNHRTSIDLDFFINTEFDIEKNNLLNKRLSNDFGELQNTKISNVGLFTFIDNIKVDLVIYPYTLNKEAEIVKNARLASIFDIGAMKMNAILGRGARKDFFDVHYLLTKISLTEMIEAYKKKYLVDNMTQLLMSLTYFEDASDPFFRNNIYEPVSHQVSWEEIKSDIVLEVRKYISSNL